MARPRIKGGDKLRRFLREAKSASRVKATEVGFFSEARYPDGTPVPAVAAWNEFGTTRIPERPFFRQALAVAPSEVAADSRSRDQSPHAGC